MWTKIKTIYMFMIIKKEVKKLHEINLKKKKSYGMKLKPN